MPDENTAYDVIVIGGGASGLMCAISAGYRGLRVLVLEKNAKVGLKILVSGGGRCNFTNLFADPRQHFLSENPNFCISAMKRYEPSDFLSWVEAEGIEYFEKTRGQLFCSESAKDIVSLLLKHCDQAGVSIRRRCEVESLERIEDGGFRVRTAQSVFIAPKLVIATGGLSMPKIASDLAFRAAGSLGLDVVAPRAALVPLRWNTADKARYESLSGISLPASVACGGATFDDAILFTHRGLSGPAILQISSFWREGEAVVIDLLPNLEVAQWLMENRRDHPTQTLAVLLRTVMPRRLVDALVGDWFADARLADCSNETLAGIETSLKRWRFMPGGSEGYRTAEVTLGGISTSQVSSRTFELEKVPGLFVIGEALDVTGWLGGYNFQWAWASGWCCGQHL